MLSLSIDFYIRVFVRVNSAPIEVKKAISSVKLVFIIWESKLICCILLIGRILLFSFV
jgi:tRNA G26 N,N-dimethylase Trm1